MRAAHAYLEGTFQSPGAAAEGYGCKRQPCQPLRAQDGERAQRWPPQKLGSSNSTAASSNRGLPPH